METQQHCQLNDALSSQIPKVDLPTSALPRRAEKIYRGIRDADGNCTVLVDEPSSDSPTTGERGTTRPLPLHLEIRNHSPNGFEWGYGGSGPAQLALALLMDATGDLTLTIRHYQNFKFSFVPDWDESWKITQSEIQAFVAAQENLAGCLGAQNSCLDC